MYNANTYNPVNPYYNDLVYRPWEYWKPWSEWPYQQSVVPDVPKPEIKPELATAVIPDAKTVWCLFVEREDDDSDDADLQAIYATKQAAEIALAACTEQYERAIMAVRQKDLERKIDNGEKMYEWKTVNHTFGFAVYSVSGLYGEDPKLDESPIESPYYIEEWLVKE